MSLPVMVVSLPNQGNSFREVYAQQAVVKSIPQVRTGNRALRDARARNPLLPAISALLLV